MSLTRNNGHIFGEIEPGLYVAGFCNGAGNSLGTASGRLLAELSAGVDSQLLADQLTLPQPGRLPPERLCRPFVQQRIASAERRRASLYAAAAAERTSRA